MQPGNLFGCAASYFCFEAKKHKWFIITWNGDRDADATKFLNEIQILPDVDFRWKWSHWSPDEDISCGYSFKLSKGHDRIVAWKF